jgi:asparagine synthase (glutamine-hydrolysing)
MCGIAGIRAVEATAPVDRQALEAMTRALSHRGPDDEGYHLGPGIGLGFRRLSIIDLETGNQPLWARDETIVCVCNGEIYNHVELRRHLEERGHRFRTQSDVEVLPALYAEYGLDFVNRLKGQFAFALWDLPRRRLVLGRDQIGIAPLFYVETRAGVLFASEIKALLRSRAVPRQVDLTGLDQVLTFPGPVSPRTLFAGIHSLPPGHLLIVDPDRAPKLACYWDLDYPREDDPPGPTDRDFHIAALDEALRASVRRRLQADVPVSAYLSGGLDSALIVAIAADLTPGETRDTFSIAFADPAIDERRYQRLLAERLGTRHHQREVAPDDILACLRDIVWGAEAPLRESYNACSLILSRMVRDEGRKVVLSGEGADELFGGYVGYRLDVDRPASDGEYDDIEAMLEAELRTKLWGDPDFFYEKPYHALGETKRALYAATAVARLPAFDSLAHSPVDPARLKGRSRFHRRSYLDFKLRMADHLLADHGDRVAFANGVEARYPFLDLDVIDCARRIPPSLMLEGGREKSLLKRLARKYLPDAVIDRPKFSFVAPASPTLLARRLPWVEDLLSADRIRRQGYFNPEMVEQLKQRYRKPGFALSQTFEDDLLMVVLTFGLFLELFDLPAL